MSIDKVLAGLPGLSQKELRVVVAAASALLGGAPVALKAKPQRAAPKPRKAKGPAKPVSPHKGKPLYEAFKAKERELHAALKRHGVSFKDAQGIQELRGLCDDFATIRERWFREKEKLATDVRQTDAQGPTQEAKMEEG